MALTCIALPHEEPVSIAELRGYLHIEENLEDELLQHLIATSRQSIEAYTGICMIEQSWCLSVNYDYCTKISDQHYLSYNHSRGTQGLELPKTPFIGLIGLPKIINGDHEYPLNSYRLDTSGRSAHLHVEPQSQYLNSEISRVSVSFKAGYGSDASTVPPSLKHATLLLAAQMFENRLGTSNDNIGLPMIMNQSVINLIKPYQSLRLI